LLAFREAAASLGWTIDRLQPDSVACTDSAGEALTVGLENLYRRVRREDRAAWPSLIADFLRKVAISGKPTDLDRDLSEVADRLLLRLGPAFPKFPGAAQVWNQPLHETGLVVSLVIDHPETMSYVTEEMIDRSGVPGQEWLERAIVNLRARTPADTFATVHEQSGIRLCTLGDAYDSSRALVVGDYLTDTPHGYFVAVPSRDELLVLPTTPAALTTIHVLKLLAMQNHQKAPYPVSEELFWVYGDKWHLFPIEIKGNEVNVRPPDEFIHVLEMLKGPDSQTL
jgi:hypothetical protein